MRELTAHRLNPSNDLLKVAVLDQPGSGGACHAYLIEGFDCASNPSVATLLDVAADRLDERVSTVVLFQNGPIADVGVNGITHEVLLAILIDRLERFQSGPYSCRENALALTKLQEALHWLHHRTASRMARGVEGTNNR